MLPVAGKDRSSLGSLGCGQHAVTARSTASGSRARRRARRSMFIDDDGTACAGCSSSGPATARRSAKDAAEKLGGTAVARLLTSGETKAVIDLSGLGIRRRSARLASALAAALRAWRYDRYRTKLKDKQKPTLAEIVDRRRRPGRRRALRASAGRRSTKACRLTRELVTEPANIIYPESFVERVQARSKAAESKSRCSTARRWRSSAWARCSASRRARSARRGC